MCEPSNKEGKCKGNINENKKKMDRTYQEKSWCEFYHWAKVEFALLRTCKLMAINF